jgi:DNA-binding NarL/FixJ family response regulator
MSDIRVLLADDHVVMREGLAVILERAEGIDIVAQADGGQEAVRLAAEHSPDVLVLDYSMPDLDAPAVMSRLKADGCTTRILILSNYEQPHYASQCLSSGALGYVAKSVAFQELVDAIHAVHAGETFLSRLLAPKMAASIGAGGTHKGLESLSAREFELMRHVGSGLSLQEAAQRMHVTESTVSTYRQRLMKKLGLRNTAEIIRFAVENELVA